MASRAPGLSRIVSTDYADQDDEKIAEGELYRVREDFHGTNHVHLSLSHNDVVKIVTKPNSLGWCEIEFVLTKYGIPPYEGQKRRGYILRGYLVQLTPQQKEYFRRKKERDDRNEQDKQKWNLKAFFASKNKNLDTTNLKGPRHRFAQTKTWSFRSNPENKKKDFDICKRDASHIVVNQFMKGLLNLFQVSQIITNCNSKGLFQSIDKKNSEEFLSVCVRISLELQRDSTNSFLISNVLFNRFLASRKVPNTTNVIYR
ncbi:hypothetical protein RFI_28953 [Reticulomyxa filosa]|uniref:SH3 domain-containing protein n=1 Tax=Reticulomyxa filosa TaxID=46433 RepID=X6M4P7_RETFI|nr:hypothetical protein RFI_28953 [Reticulomyxa filosa]|eukprot:ETO08432.1 hypothetical protein RFI_28953 [Reticulomyxa filosa]